MLRLDSGVSGLSEEPPTLDRPVKDEAHKQFCGTGDELRSPPVLVVWPSLTNPSDIPR
jgi:hypothetical protein